MLTDDEFTIGSTTRTIRRIQLVVGALFSVTLSSSLSGAEIAALSIEFGTSSFSFADAS